MTAVHPIDPVGKVLRSPGAGPGGRSAVHPLLTYPADALQISPWPEPDGPGPTFDPRSAYVEEFWLGILGPSTTWLVRRLAAGFDEHPGGFSLPLATAARSLGLGDRGGRHSPFLRSVNRLLMFDLGQAVGPDHLAVRRRVPVLSPRQIHRLGPGRDDDHRRWLDAHSLGDEPTVRAPRPLIGASHPG